MEVVFLQAENRYESGVRQHGLEWKPWVFSHVAQDEGTEQTTKSKAVSSIT